MNLQLTGFLFYLLNLSKYHESTADRIPVYLLNLPKYHESTADRISVSFANAPTKFSKIKKVENFFYPTC